MFNMPIDMTYVSTVLCGMKRTCDCGGYIIPEAMFKGKLQAVGFTVQNTDLKLYQPKKAFIAESLREPEVGKCELSLPLLGSVSTKYRREDKAIRGIDLNLYKLGSDYICIGIFKPATGLAALGDKLAGLAGMPTKLGDMCLATAPNLYELQQKLNKSLRGLCIEELKVVQKSCEGDNVAWSFGEFKTRNQTRGIAPITESEQADFDM